MYSKYLIYTLLLANCLSIRCVHWLLPNFYGIHRKGEYRSGKIESDSFLGTFYFDKLFYAKNVSLPDTLFDCICTPGNDSCNPSCYYGYQNLLFQMGKGDENYIIFFRNMILRGDENYPCAVSFYGLINMVNNKPNYSKSVICFDNCELPYNYWIPSKINFYKNDIRIFCDSTKNNSYDKGNIKFLIKGTVDSTFQLDNYLAHFKKYENLAK